MPPLRDLPSPHIAGHPHVLLYAPKLYDLGFKQHHIDGDALALCAHLRREGFTCTLLDAYYRAVQTPPLRQAVAEAKPPVDVVLVHLWTSDAYGPRLRVIADELADLRRHCGVPVIGFGPLATSAADELLAHEAIDQAIGLERSEPSAVDIAPATTLAASIGRYLRTPARMTAFTDADLPYMEDAVISVSASRGCRGRCTFCAYNADLGGGWLELPMTQAVGDIVHLHRLTGARQFAFADSDFGGTRASCRERAQALLNELVSEGLAGKLRISINVRSETLEPETVRLLALAGVQTMLIGVESLNDATLHRLYGIGKTSHICVRSSRPLTNTASAPWPATSCGIPGRASKAYAMNWPRSMLSAVGAYRSSWPARGCSSSPAQSSSDESGRPDSWTRHRSNGASASPTQPCKRSAAASQTGSKPTPYRYSVTYQSNDPAT
jgi:radical SAM family protein